MQISGSVEVGIPLEVELDYTCDVEEIIMVYVHLQTPEAKLYLEYFTVTNLSNQLQWEVPVYNFLGANVMNCKLSCLLWAHPVVEDLSLVEPPNFSVTSSSTTTDYDPLLDSQFYV